MSLSVVTLRFVPVDLHLMAVTADGLDFGRLSATLIRCKEVGVRGLEGVEGDPNEQRVLIRAKNHETQFRKIASRVVYRMNFLLMEHIEGDLTALPWGRRLPGVFAV